MRKCHTPAFKRVTHSEDLISSSVLDKELLRKDTSFSVVRVTDVQGKSVLSMSYAERTHSQVFPFPVLSFKLPGANVPDWSATRGSPPTLAICLASSNAIFLFKSFAPAEAGS